MPVVFSEKFVSKAEWELSWELFAMGIVLGIPCFVFCRFSLIRKDKLHQSGFQLSLIAV